MDELKIKIPIAPRTKKNSQNIVYAGGRPLVVQSKAYKAYEKACALYVHRKGKPISTPVNVKMVFYTETRRVVDLAGLEQACQDILVLYGVLADDNRKIVWSKDGSRALYSKENPRTEITITPITKDEMVLWKSILGKEGKTDGN